MWYCKQINSIYGAASAYTTILREIDKEVISLSETYPDIFEFSSLSEGIIEVRDF